MSRSPPEKLPAREPYLNRRVTARAPTRIDLGGGWTDVPPYCDREGGFVCNVAITRYATATLGDPAAATEAPLARAALRRAGIAIPVVIRNDFPLGAGLGGSSAASAALLTAIATWKGESWTRDAVAELGRAIEVEDLGVAGGWQDHYAATHGGALALTFTSVTAVRRIPLAPATKASLPRRCLLIYTGESRVSGATITAVLGAYERGDRQVVRALSTMKELAGDMARALEAGDLDPLGELLREHWVHQRSLHHSIPTPRIDEIVERASALGAGAKAMGASGGGCVLVVGREDGMEPLRQALGDMGDFLDFSIDETGVETVENGGA